MVDRIEKMNKVMGFTTSDLMIKKIKEFEGLRLEAYVDAAGVMTIGYGHTGRNAERGNKISQYYAEELLRRDLDKVESQVNALGVAHTQGQFDALVSFTFNVGIGRLKSSTLLKVIRNGGSRKQIKKEFKRWVYAGGKVLKGLERRREYESKRYFD